MVLALVAVHGGVPPLTDLNGLLYPAFISVLFKAYYFTLVPAYYMIVLNYYVVCDCRLKCIVESVSFLPALVITDLSPLSTSALCSLSRVPNLRPVTPMYSRSQFRQGSEYNVSVTVNKLATPS